MAESPASNFVLDLKHLQQLGVADILLDLLAQGPSQKVDLRTRINLDPLVLMRAHEYLFSNGFLAVVEHPRKLLFRLSVAGITAARAIKHVTSPAPAAKPVTPSHWQKVQTFLSAWEEHTWAYLDCLNTLKRMHPDQAPQYDAANRKVSVLQAAISIAMFEHEDLRVGEWCDRRHDGYGGKVSFGVEAF